MTIQEISKGTGYTWNECNKTVINFNSDLVRRMMPSLGGDPVLAILSICSGLGLAPEEFYKQLDEPLQALIKYKVTHDSV